jgi:hypothetical protein
MSGCQHNPTGRGRLSRAMAFESQGVLLEHPSHSWSGVRGSDGAVVVAIHASWIQVGDDGCCCLLWSPANRAEAWMERVSHQERLEHCRLAVRRDAADGLLAYGEEAMFDADEVIALSVAKIGDQYWAKWGSVARAEEASRFIRPGTVPAAACFTLACIRPPVGEVGAFRTDHYTAGVE